MIGATNGGTKDKGGAVMLPLPGETRQNDSLSESWNSRGLYVLAMVLIVP
jgi:hypothetical protein